MLKHNPKIKKAFKKLKKTGDTSSLTTELQEQVTRGLEDNKELTTVI